MRTVCVGSPTCPHPAVLRGRCHLHAPAAQQRRHPYDHIYADRRWPWLSRQVRAEEPLCRLKLPGCTVVTEVADHVRPHRGDERLAFDRDNLQGACRACNSRKGTRRTPGAGVKRSEARDRFSPAGNDARVASTGIPHRRRGPDGR
jgi:5-methylcytosine-specific restriction endonuclease McrA